MTNHDRLNGSLDKIIETTESSNIRILATRMRNDEDFAVSALAFFTILCTIDPFILDTINKRVLRTMLKNLLDD